MSKEKIILTKKELQDILEKMERKQKHDSGENYIELTIDREKKIIEVYQPCCYSECCGNILLEKNL